MHRNIHWWAVRTKTDGLTVIMSEWPKIYATNLRKQLKKWEDRAHCARGGRGGQQP